MSGYERLARRAKAVVRAYEYRDDVRGAERLEQAMAWLGMEMAQGGEAIGCVSKTRSVDPESGKPGATPESLVVDLPCEVTIITPITLTITTSAEGRGVAHHLPAEDPFVIATRRFEVAQGDRGKEQVVANDPASKEVQP